LILVDSSVWIDYFNGVATAATDKLDSLLGTEPVAVGDLILVEVLQGFRHERDHGAAKALLTSLTLFDLLGRHMAIRAAENFRTLRKRGITVRKTADAIIATFCIEQGHALLYSDRDFDPFHQHLNLRSVLVGT